MDFRVNKFCNRTGAGNKEAKEFLSSFTGDLEAAIDAYNLLSKVPAPGPQKNQQMQQQQQMAGSPPLSPQDMQRKYLKRGLSKTTENIRLVNQLREQHADTIVEEEDPERVETPDYTFILPDLTVYPDDFRAFLHKELIETSTLVSLEHAGRLNWWSDLSVCQRLLPLATTGDGNCLLHAASLGMWGFHDRLLTLRKTLFAALTHGHNKAEMWRRWRWHQSQLNKQSGLILSEEEWSVEWNGLLKLASTKPRVHPDNNGSSPDSSPEDFRIIIKNCIMDIPPSEPVNGGGGDEEVCYESLEEFHVFVLAHCLRRPIIVVADTILKDSNGEALAPIPFGGIYLPLLVSPADCHTSPLLLTYDAAHFSALVAMDTDEGASGGGGNPAGNGGAGAAGNNIHSAIPLVDPNWELLPIHFLVDPGEKYDWRTETPATQYPNLDAQLNVLSRYLDVLSLPLPASVTPSPPITPNDGPMLVNGGGNHGGNGFQRRSSNESEEGKIDKKKNKQLQGVAKSFGSLGKSLGKNFKKMGTLGKDKEKDKEKDKKKVKIPPTANIAGVANNGGLSAEVLADRQHVLCAKLLYKRMAYQDEIVRNYLDSAEERFRSEQEVMKYQQQEWNAQNNKPVECINQGCKGKGTADTSYLCKSCFEKQKAVESNRDRSDGEQYSRGEGPDDGMASALGLSPMHINSVAAAGVNSSPAFTRHDTLITTGKSKFYTTPLEEHSVSASPNNRQQQTHSHHRFTMPQQPPPPFSTTMMNSSASTSALPSTVELSRSSFYDNSLSHLPPPPSNPPPRYVNNLKSKPAVARSTAVAQEIPASQALAATFMSAEKQIDSVNLLRNNEVPLSLSQQSQKPQPQQPLKLTNKTLDYKDTHYKLNVNLNQPSGVSKSGGGKLVTTDKCRTPNCEFFGTTDTDFLCSACYKRKHSELLRQAELQQHKHTNL